MSLLLNTNIDDRVKDVIRGNIGRVGGRVNQLINYSLCSVKDINLLNGGYGEILKSNDSAKISSSIKLAGHYIKQELIYLRRGSMIPRDRKTDIFDMNDAYSKKDKENLYDCMISSNMLEHSANPIFLLLNFYFMTKKNGYQFHALPHYKYTFDMYRKPTTVEHLYEDFYNKTKNKDTTHNEDYYRSAVLEHGAQKEFHKQYPISYPYIHFHVFDEYNTLALFSSIFEDVQVDVLKTEYFSDVVVVFKNELKKTFVDNHREYLEKNFNYGE